MSEIVGAAHAGGHDDGLGNSPSESGGASDNPDACGVNPPPALLTDSAALSTWTHSPAPESPLTVCATRITPKARSTASCCSGDQSPAGIADSLSVVPCGPCRLDCSAARLGSSWSCSGTSKQIVRYEADVSKAKRWRGVMTGPATATRRHSFPA